MVQVELRVLGRAGDRSRCAGTRPRHLCRYKSTCFTGTNVQILTPEELLHSFPIPSSDEQSKVYQSHHPGIHVCEARCTSVIRSLLRETSGLYCFTAPLIASRLSIHSCQHLSAKDHLYIYIYTRR